MKAAAFVTCGFISGGEFRIGRAQRVHLDPCERGTKGPFFLAAAGGRIVLRGSDVTGTRDAFSEDGIGGIVRADGSPVLARAE